MKKLALVLLAGISFATANAQFQFGVKAGANFSNVNGDNVSGTSTLVGFNGGVFFKLPLGHHFSLQPELLYSGQGFKQDDGNGGTTTQTEGYFNIPVLLKYTLPVGLFAETGPQVGFLTAAKVKDAGVSVTDKTDFNSTDFAWAFGVGFKIPTTHLAIDARYNLGLANIVNNGATGVSSNSVHNGSFQIGLMYTLFSAPVRK